MHSRFIQLLYTTAVHYLGMKWHRTNNRLNVGSLWSLWRWAFVGQQLWRFDDNQQRRTPRLARRVFGDDRESTGILVLYCRDVKGVNVTERLKLVVFRHQLVVEQPLDLQHHGTMTHNPPLPLPHCALNTEHWSIPSHHVKLNNLLYLAPPHLISHCAFLAERSRLCYSCVCRLSSSVTLCIVAKRCVLEQKLLLRAYRKSYMRNQLVSKWMTLTFV